MAEKVSILDNGQKTHTFTYRVNGVKVYESLDLDTANGNFAKTVSIKIKEKGKFIDVSPNSELGQAIANGDDGGREHDEDDPMKGVRRENQEMYHLNPARWRGFSSLTT